MSDEKSLQIRKAYDAAAKSLLADKKVIANILKYAVKEFKSYRVDEIVSFLCGEPEIGTEPVDDDFPPKMDFSGGESVSSADGIRTYDIKFKVKIPGKEEIEIIINIESQNNYYPGYTLEKRGIYHLSRLISSQYNVEFAKSDFDKLKKVYSIWICTHSPLESANTITEYSFRPEFIVGHIKDRPERYDLMSLIMINLGKTNENYDGLIKMLDTLLNKLVNDRKNSLSVLENDFGISLIHRSKEVDNMCNLSIGVFDEGMAKGIAEGRAEGKAIKAIEVTEELLKEGFPIEKALKITGIDMETYRKYKDKTT